MPGCHAGRMHSLLNIREALQEARLQPVASPTWWQAVTDALRACREHLDSYEHSLLADFGQRARPQLLSQLTRQWAAFTAARTRDTQPRHRPSAGTSLQHPLSPQPAGMACGSAAGPDPRPPAAFPPEPAPASGPGTPDGTHEAALSSNEQFPGPQGRVPASQRFAFGACGLRVTGSARPPRLILAGDIDEATYPVLTAALAKITAGPGEIHIDLSAVTYCDLAGLRTLTGLAGGGGPQRPRQVILHRPPAHLAEVLHILGWDTTPGLTLDGTPAPPPATHGTCNRPPG